MVSLNELWKEAYNYKPESLKNLKNYPESCLTERALPDKFIKAEKLSPNGQPVYTYNAGMSDMDINGHMNNVRYADMAYNALARDFADKVAFFNISYLSECRLGDAVEVFAEEKEGKRLALGRAEGRDIFAAEIVFEKIKTTLDLFIALIFFAVIRDLEPRCQSVIFWFLLSQRWSDQLHRHCNLRLA
ncbi:MAG: hypothetical protein EOM76_11100 [Sphingobacteriia bacterium]|nr:hypothetical protein [Sphingobacteriia bacterium]